jgi:hypothetical protein
MASPCLPNRSRPAMHSFGMIFRHCCVQHIHDCHVASIHRRRQKRKMLVAAQERSRARSALTDPWITALFQEPAQAYEMVGVRPWTVGLGMLQGVGVHGKQMNSAISRIAVLQGQNCFVALLTALCAAGDTSTAQRTNDGERFGSKIQSGHSDAFCGDARLHWRSRAKSPWSFPKSSSPDSRRQKQPVFKQHLLSRLPEPHGQRSFLPTFSTSSLLPWTTRTRRFTLVSDGNPLRRLLIGSKKTAGVQSLAGP